WPYAILISPGLIGSPAIAAGAVIVSTFLKGALMAKPTTNAPKKPAHASSTVFAFGSESWTMPQTSIGTILLGGLLATRATPKTTAPTNQTNNMVPMVTLSPERLIECDKSQMIIDTLKAKN